MFSVTSVTFAFCKLFFCHDSLENVAGFDAFMQFPYQLSNKEYLITIFKRESSTRSDDLELYATYVITTHLPPPPLWPYTALFCWGKQPLFRTKTQFFLSCKTSIAHAVNLVVYVCVKIENLNWCWGLDICELLQSEDKSINERTRGVLHGSWVLR